MSGTETSALEYINETVPRLSQVYKKHTIDRLISTVPRLFQVRRGMLLYDLFDCFGREIDTLNDMLSRVFESHMVDLADSELEKTDTPVNLREIGNLFDIKPEKNESILSYRKRLKSTIRIFLAGLGTIDSIINMTALTYECGVKSIERRTIDEFTIRALLTSSDNGDPQDFEIMVIENPDAHVRQPPLALYPGLQFEVWNNGLFPVIPSIELYSNRQSLSNPVITNLTTNQQLIYNGTIPEGMLFSAKPTPDAMRYTIQIGSLPVEDIDVYTGVFFDGGTFDNSVFAQKGSAIILPRGRSLIQFDLPPAVFDSAYFDGAHFRMEPVGQYDCNYFDGCSFPPEDPCGNITFSWIERKPAAFKVVLPYILFSEQQEKTKKLRSILEIVKPAGVESIVDTEIVIGEETVPMSDTVLETHIAGTISDSIEMDDTGVAVAVDPTSLSDEQAMEEQIVFGGVFDMTPFGSSLFD